MSTLTSTTPQPVPPPLPSSTKNYREALGQYADLVLGDGLVPHGSIEHLEFLATCVRSAGFHVELDLEERSLTARPGGEQESAYREVLATCEEAAFSSGLVKRPGPPDDEFLAARYDAFMLTYQCLSANSYPVSPPPSKELYIESGGTIWHPYERLSPLSVPQVERECPQDLIVLFETLATHED
jgi:hypothetical protein